MKYKKHKFNFVETSALIEQTEKTIEQGVAAAAPKLENVRDITDMPPAKPLLTCQGLYHKEKTQDVLIHLPLSLHKRLTELKNQRYEDYGERVTINNMAIEAVHQWLRMCENSGKVE